MAFVIPELPEIIAALVNIYSLEQIIKGLLDGQSGGGTVNPVNAQLAQVNGKLDLLIQNDQLTGSELATIEALLLNLPRGIGGTPVTLPPTPPPGYTPSDPAGIAAQVWAYSVADGAPTTYNELLLGRHLWYANSVQLLQPWTLAPDFYLKVVSSDELPFFPAVNPDINWANLLPSDTSLSFLTREASAFTWLSGAGLYERPWTGLVDTGRGVEWIFRWNDAEFAVLKAARIGQLQLAAPIWPGFDLVTLGDEVALDRATTVNVPMHGVIINLETTPPDKPKYQIGVLLATAHIGQITFTDDRGHPEFPQLLSMSSQIYVPKDMVKASSVEIRTVIGVTGSVQPWTITP